MRVLHVIPSVSGVHGGPSQALAVMEQGLCASGVSVTTATTDDDGPGRRLKIDARPAEAHGARRVYCRKWLDFYKVAPAMLPWLWRHVRTFDVVHIHSLFSFTSVAAGLVAHWHRVPYVVRPLGTLTQYGVTRRRPWLKLLSLAVLEAPILRHAAAVHFTSDGERDEVKPLNLPLRGVVIPLAVRAEARGDAQRLLQDYPVLGDRQIVLYLSRLDPKKNVESLLRAFALVRAQQEDVALVIAGDGPGAYVGSLKMLARVLGVEHYVVWLGPVGDARKAAALAAAQVFVLPSLSENFGIAAAEAMLAGLPCVLGRGVAIAQQVQEAGAGIVVSPEPGAIARALTELLADDVRRSALGERAREFARQEFSMQAMADRLSRLYLQVVAEGPKSA